MRASIWLLGSLLFAALGAAHAAADPAVLDRPPPTPIRASKIVLVGDSTTAVQGGWGPAFCARHVTSFLTCTNLARGGRSTYNYRAEGSWALAQAEMRTPGYARTWVLVQFGHNDQPGKPGRSTDLQREFPDNLRRYVREIRAAGAQPVLVTPLTRRQFTDGVLIDDLAHWAEAVRSVAREMEVPLVDLHARSRAVVQALGRWRPCRWPRRRPPRHRSARRWAVRRWGQRPPRGHRPRRTTPSPSRWARPRSPSTTPTWAPTARRCLPRW